MIPVDPIPMFRDKFKHLFWVLRLPLRPTEVRRKRGREHGYVDDYGLSMTTCDGKTFLRLVKLRS